jgi:hypothetical protein
MMHSFQIIPDALINRLEREEGGMLMHVEGLQNIASNHVHRELEKVKIPKFWGSIDG